MRKSINAGLTTIGIFGILLAFSDSPYFPYVNFIGVGLMFCAVYIYNKYIKD